MCGICGYFYKDIEKTIDIEILNHMVDSMAHRGPDDRGIFIENGGGIGQRRLSIIDIIGGNQPMLHASETAVIVTNGEIYNYPEICRDYLPDLRDKCSSDTAVLLNFLYEKNVAAIELLNGMFAFAYWDLENMRVVFARDPVGQKPLFYYFGPKSFIFGSELSSIACHPDLPTEIEIDSLALYLLFEGYPHPYSPFKGVRKLSPGHFMVLDIKNWDLKIERYWYNDPSPTSWNLKEETHYVKQFEHIFEESLIRHLRSDVEVGIFLSGGLDSPSIVKGVSKLYPDRKFKTFTIKHEIDTFDEASSARATAQYFGTEHHEKLLTEGEFLNDIDPLLLKNDEPIADPGFLAIYQVAKFSRQFVKVILSGNGSDEFFAGYHPFHALDAYQVVNRYIPRFIIGMVSFILGRSKANHDYMNFPFRVERFLRGVSCNNPEVLIQWIGSFNHLEINKLLNSNIRIRSTKELSNDGYIQLYQDIYNSCEQLPMKDLFSIVLNVFQQFYLPVCICNHSDKASMRVSQELRSPFLDVEMMRFANRLPNQIKYRHRKTKYILRKYHAHNSPKGIKNRPKQGFTVPIAFWLTNSLRTWANDILDPIQIKKDGLFDETEVRRLWDEHQERKANHAKKLWTILAFQHWFHNTRSNRIRK